jgi:hypothetical protein
MQIPQHNQQVSQRSVQNSVANSIGNASGEKHEVPKTLKGQDELKKANAVDVNLALPIHSIPTVLSRSIVFSIQISSTETASFVVRVYPEWAPLGAERFLKLVNEVNFCCFEVPES